VFCYSFKTLLNDFVARNFAHRSKYTNWFV
jgi:hypothetical protein